MGGEMDFICKVYCENVEQAHNRLNILYSTFATIKNGLSPTTRVLSLDIWDTVWSSFIVPRRFQGHKYNGGMVTRILIYTALIQ